MRRYETITIIDPDLTAEDRKPILDRISELIAQQDGFLAMFDEWGSKKLAYEIKKKSHGYYLRVDFCGTGALIDEMERFFRIDDRVLKYMTVLVDEAADIESIKNEIALAESEAKKAAASSQPAIEEAPEKTAEPDTGGESAAAPATPADDTESESGPDKTAVAAAEAESKTEPAVADDVTESEPSSQKPAAPDAETEDRAEPAALKDDVGSEPPPEQAADAETESDKGSEKEQPLTAESKKEEQ